MFGSAPEPSPLRQLAADVDLRLGVRDLQLLHVGVHRDELHLVDPGVDHPVDGVQPRTADADDLDLREVRAELSRARVVQARRRLEHRLDVPRDGRLGNVRRRRSRLRCRVRSRRPRRRHGLRLRRLGYRIGTRRRRRVDLVLPGRDVLDGRLVRLLGGRCPLVRLLLRCAASVALKSSASGPSRMLARFRAIEHLLREVAVAARAASPLGS